MTHPFEVREEIELEATPEEVWAAIATGPGVDSWFIGHNEIEPRQGGRTTMTFLGGTSENTVTAWEPGRRFATRGDEAPDGTFMAFEWLIEGREGGSTVLRLVHNGLLGDNWEAEYDALSNGDRMYLQKLAVYLKHFPGRTANAVTFAPGPQVPDNERVWSAFAAALGLTGPAEQGAKVRLSVDGLPAEEGTVEFLRFPEFLTARTDDGIYMLVHGYDGSILVEHHNFAEGAATAETDKAWEAWLGRTFA